MITVVNKASDSPSISTGSSQCQSPDTVIFYPGKGKDKGTFSRFWQFLKHINFISDGKNVDNINNKIISVVFEA